MSQTTFPSRSRSLWQKLKMRHLLIALMALMLGAMGIFFWRSQNAEPAPSQETSIGSLPDHEKSKAMTQVQPEGTGNMSPISGETAIQARKENQDHKDSEMLVPGNLEDFIDMLRQDRLDFATAMSYLAEYEDSLNLVELRSSLEGMATTSTQKSILLLLLVKTGAIDDALRFVESDNFINETGNYLVHSIYGDALLQSSRYQESLQSYQRAFDILQNSQEEDRSVKLQLLKQNIDRVRARIPN